MIESENKTQNNNGWHVLPLENIFQILNSNSSGLSDKAAKHRQKEFGKNELPKHTPPGPLKIFIWQFLSPLIYILVAAGIISIALGDWKDAFFIFAVIFLNAFLGTYQEWKAEKSAASLQNLLKTITVVKRHGHEIEIEAEELVRGDVVLLESGNKVPADIRIISEHGLMVDESPLTGESLPVNKRNISLNSEVDITERENILYAGTTVTSGRAMGMVVEIGANTEMGKIASSVIKSKGSKAPLIIRMEHFSRKISLIILFACFLLAILAVSKGIPYAEVFFLAVALAVSAIPEGLPVAMTVALSIAANKMSKRNVIVRKLSAVESLGSCTLIATDKTGTLTYNKQTVRTIWTPGHKRYDLTGEGYKGEGEVVSAESEKITANEMKQLKDIAIMSSICNEATLFKKHGKWEMHGDTVDIAMLAMSYKMGVDPESIKKHTKIIGEIPFESVIRFSAKFFHDGHGNEVAVKGALESLLPRCENMMVNGKIEKIDRKEIEKAGFMLAAEGFRVLAVTKGKVGEKWPKKDLNKTPLDEADLPSLTLLGLVGLIDPLREEVADSVKKSREAGIKVVMVTGDHPATALAIAKELGIAVDEEDVITGKDLNDYGSSDMPGYLDIVNKKNVFARVNPMQKMDIVSAQMKLGHFVAVTGDGVNDTPALRKANIGIAMGSGTDATKDTASIIISDDNFVSIVAGIEEGRHAYNNVRKVIYLLISQGAAEILLFAFALLAGLPIPLLAVQLLWLNLATNGIQSVALSFEGGEDGVMKKKPRKPSETIFNPQMLKQTALSGCTIAVVSFITWYVLLVGGMPEFEARNILLFLMVLIENMHIFNTRSETVSAFRVSLSKNYFLLFGVVAAQLLHVFSTYIPFMQEVLKVEPISFTRWLMILPFAAIIVLVMEIFKKLQKSTDDSKENVMQN